MSTLLGVFVASGIVTMVAVTDAFDSSQPSTSGGPLEVGRAFPTLVLPDAVDGHPRSIGEFRGRKVILHIFASW